MTAIRNDLPFDCVLGREGEGCFGIRRSDEPKLEIGDTVLMRDGVVGLVLARFVPSGESCNEVHYVVELKPDGSEKGRA